MQIYVTAAALLSRLSPRRLTGGREDCPGIPVFPARRVFNCARWFVQLRNFVISCSWAHFPAQLRGPREPEPEFTYQMAHTPVRGVRAEPDKCSTASNHSVEHRQGMCGIALVQLPRPAGEACDAASAHHAPAACREAANPDTTKATHAMRTPPRPGPTRLRRPPREPGLPPAAAPGRLPAAPSSPTTPPPHGARRATTPGAPHRAAGRTGPRQPAGPAARRGRIRPPARNSAD
jgi:hypothetical protein